MATTAGDDANEISGTAYHDLLKEQLLEERARKEAIERRGTAIISASAFSATVLFGAAALASLAQDDINWVLRVSAGLSILALFGSTLLALHVNRIMDYCEVEVDVFRKVLDEEFWFASSPRGDRRAAEVRTKILQDWRSKNDAKARALQKAFKAQSIAIIFVLVSVGVTLWS